MFKTCLGSMWVLVCLCASLVACGGGDEDLATGTAEQQGQATTGPAAEQVAFAETEPAGEQDAPAGAELTPEQATPATPEPTDEVPTDIAKELTNIVPYILVVTPQPGERDEGRFCVQVPAEEEVVVTRVRTLLGQTAVCLWAFPLGETVRVELYDPQGRLAETAEVPVSMIEPGVGVVEVLPWLAGQQAGEWTVVATAGRQVSQARIEVSEPKAPVLSVVPQGKASLLEGERWLLCGQDVHRGLEPVRIVGAGFPGNSKMTLAVYCQTSPTAARQRVWDTVVRSDRQGRFEQDFVRERGEPRAGTCYALVPLERSYRPAVGELDPAGAIACFQLVP